MQDRPHAISYVCEQLYRRPHAKSLIISYTGNDLPVDFGSRLMGGLDSGRLASTQHLKLPWCFITEGDFTVSLSM